MKVKEMIEELKKFDPEKEVKIIDEDKTWLNNRLVVYNYIILDGYEVSDDMGEDVYISVMYQKGYFNEERNCKACCKFYC